MNDWRPDRRGESKHLMIPGWPYSIVAALEVGRTSWTALLDAVRLEPGADVADTHPVSTNEAHAGQLTLGPRAMRTDMYARDHVAWSCPTGASRAGCRVPRPPGQGLMRRPNLRQSHSERRILY